jgi:hypothetical protein
MQVITAVYLNCRPDLRDEWLTGIEVDDISDAQVSLRLVVTLCHSASCGRLKSKLYVISSSSVSQKLLQPKRRSHARKCFVDNTKRYGAAATHLSTGGHRRTSSLSHHLEGLHPGPELSGIIRPVGTPNTVEADVFPPLRAQQPDPSIFLPYVTEDIAFEEEYQEYLSDLGWSDQPTLSGGEAAVANNASAWARLPELDISDNISDSESIPSIGELGDEARLDVDREDREVLDENRNNWEVSHHVAAGLPFAKLGCLSDLLRSI